MYNVVRFMNANGADCIICGCTQGIVHSTDVYRGTALVSTLPVSTTPSRSPLLNRMTERFPRKKAHALHKVHVKTEENCGGEKSLTLQHQRVDLTAIMAVRLVH